MPIRVADLMTRSVLTTTPSAKATDAALVIALRDITALPVLDHQHLVGMFAEANLLRLTAAHTTPLVRDVMAPLKLVAAPNGDAAELAGAMRRRGILSVPVLDGSKLVGIITRRDLARAGVALHAATLTSAQTTSAGGD